MALTIAHLSDVHLPHASAFGLRHARLKRGLGLINWHYKRRRIHRPEAIEAILADLALQTFDHIVVTGDLTNLGLPDEHANALGWLAALGPPGRVSAIPGNHDIYVSLRRDPGVARWSAYMASDDWGRTVTAGWDGFPYVRRLGPAALIGLNSAVPMPPFFAAGELGDTQLGRLEAVLTAVRAAGLVRIVLIHHPPLPGQAPPRRALRDAAALGDVLARCGAELVLHGHNHRNMQADAAVPGGAAVVLGVPSLSAGRMHHQEPLARYNLIRLETASAGGAVERIELIGRGLAAAAGPVVEIERRRIRLPAP